MLGWRHMEMRSSGQTLAHHSNCCPLRRKIAEPLIECSDISILHIISDHSPVEDILLQAPDPSLSFVQQNKCEV